MLERRSRVLVVDDDLEMCAMLNEYLSKEQFDVELAHNGDTALTVIGERRPDIVLLDVSMPRLGGFEVLRRLRSESDLPVLMLTARDEHGDRIHGLELGADDYLTKPFNARELVEVTLTQDAHEVHIAVRDHGPGVPEAELSRIFEPFYRAGRVDAKHVSADGTGIGLAITQRAAALHGGRVVARNAEDGGLIVTLTLPRADQRAEI